MSRIINVVICRMQQTEIEVSDDFIIEPGATPEFSAAQLATLNAARDLDETVTSFHVEDASV